MRRIDLMIIGAQKAGTTSLKNYLNEHPDIVGHPQHEFAYFGSEQEFQEPWEAVYEKNFTEGRYNASKIVAKHIKIANDELAVQRLKQHNPDCQLVFIVRNPVDRAFSSYTMDVARFNYAVPFSKIREVIKDHDKEHKMFRIYLSLGMYSENLKMIYKYFPKEQVHVYLFEDLKKKPLKICKDIFKLLGIDDGFKPQVEVVHNKTKPVRSEWVADILKRLRQRDNPIKMFAKKVLPHRFFTRISYSLVEINKKDTGFSAMDTATRRDLEDFFRPYNKELQELTGIDLSSWERKEASGRG
jgi:hypothetical protein